MKVFKRLTALNGFRAHLHERVSYLSRGPRTRRRLEVNYPDTSATTSDSEFRGSDLPLDRPIAWVKQSISALPILQTLPFAWRLRPGGQPIRRTGCARRSCKEIHLLSRRSKCTEENTYEDANVRV